MGGEERRKSLAKKLEGRKKKGQNTEKDRKRWMSFSKERKGGKGEQSWRGEKEE